MAESAPAECVLGERGNKSLENISNIKFIECFLKSNKNPFLFIWGERHIIALCVLELRDF